MLAPQFTLRILLALVAIAGLVSLIFAMATRGHLWAVATLIAISGLGLTMLLQAVLFAIARVLGLAAERRKHPRPKVERRPAV